MAKKTHERPLMIAEAKHISTGPNNKMKVSANFAQKLMNTSSALSIVKTKFRRPNMEKDLLLRVVDEDIEAGEGLGIGVALVLNDDIHVLLDKRLFFLASHCTNVISL